jgi:phosphonoacetaldehyde hydrolase
MNSLIHSVIFDWAGTTIDFGSMAPTLALCESFHRYGINLAIDDARGPMGIKKDEHVRALLTAPAVAMQFEQVHGRKVLESDALKIYASLEDTLDEIVMTRLELIPGHWDFVNWLRQRNVKIGSTTGYTRQTMSLILSEVARVGYSPDCCITPSESRGGRPAPWMLWQNLEQLGCDAPWKAVKFGDTESDIEEGRNAGTWSIGYSCSGNMMGLDEADWKRLPQDERTFLQHRAEQKLLAAGAHLVVEGPWMGQEAILEMERRIELGLRP